MSPASVPESSDLVAYVEVLTCGHDALQSSLLLSIERRASYGTGTTVIRRYIFDVPEELVRFCGTHKYKLHKLAGVFCTSGCKTTGLPELFLFAGKMLGLPSLHARGPKGMTAFVETTLYTMGGARSTKILAADASAPMSIACQRDEDALCYEDEHVRIYAVNAAATDTGERPAAKKRRAGSGGSAPHRATVGYRCCLKAGGVDVLVLPDGAAAVGADSSEEPVSPFVVHLGRRPDGSGAREIGLTCSGRRRGLHKFHERLCRWRFLCPELLLPDAPVAESSTSTSPDPILRAYILPAAKLESGYDEVVDRPAVLEELQAELQEWQLMETLKTVQAEVSRAPTDREQPEFVFLGTGSAQPTSKRGQSAILVRLQNFLCMLDCGGGTWGQMVRLFGEQGAERLVDDLSMVWISHAHADHCAGLPALLRHRTLPGLKVVAPQRVARYWKAYVEFAGCGPGGAAAAPHLSHHNSFKRPDEAGWPEVVMSVPVMHMDVSYALLLRKGSVQAAYSGDCRPSDSLVAAALEDKAGHPSVQTFLIHEATFNPDEQDKAIFNKHSTTLEALKIGERMAATGVLLTHFSQRYAGIELTGSSTGSNGNRRNSEDTSAMNTQQNASTMCQNCEAAAVPPGCQSAVTGINMAGAAFDGMRINAAQLKAFGSARHVFEDYWLRKFEKTEKLRKTQMPVERQPHPGALFPRSYFQKAGCASSAAADRPSQNTVSEGNEDKKVCEMSLQSRLRAFYLRVNPEKATDAVRVARLFEGKEHFLNSKLHERYGEDLRDMVQHTETTEGRSSSDSESAEGGHATMSIIRARKRPPPAVAAESERQNASARRALQLPPPPPPPPPPAPKLLAMPAAIRARDTEGCLMTIDLTDDVSQPRTETARIRINATLQAAAAACSPAEAAQKPMSPSRKPQKKTFESSSSDEEDAPGREQGVHRVFEMEQTLGLSRQRRATGPAAADGALDDLQRKLKAFYMQHNPAKVSDAATLARMFLGKVDQLNERLRARYNGLDLSSAPGVREDTVAALGEASDSSSVE
eukprot:TRINITY_DN22642_c0_g1_i2.p1 TRINITY_DN22642_c0_g1~~TRINITY_DN22642_c0_g1_i2.p1  ORF type:complete len:1037 (-),score=141.09 TRINITY_DN22642_c0_g1_i2:71-3181(-)